jgi:serine/threonine protein kinase
MHAERVFAQLYARVERQKGAAASSASSICYSSMPVVARNQVLKGEFRVCALLGEGACAEVYICERVAGAKLSRAQKLQRSSADLVVKVAPIPQQTKRKAKDFLDRKRAADTLFAEHLLYANVLNRHPRRFGTKVGFGEDRDVRYLVLERLGPSLGDEIGKKRLIPQHLANIGEDCLASLEVLHSQKYVYCDMKPENIMLGTCEGGKIKDTHEARLVDFGVATRYVSAVSGRHRQADEGSGQAGTPRFASLASSTCPPSRRDDVEALAYVLLCAAAGDRLPWDAGASDDAVLALKKGCGDAYGVLAALEADLTGFTGDARPLADFLADARALDHDQAPDYERLRGHLRTLAASAAKRRRSGAPASGKRRKAPAPADESSSEDEAPRPPRRKSTARKSPKKAPAGLGFMASIQSLFGGKEDGPMDESSEEDEAPRPPPRRNPAARKAAARKSPKKAPAPMDESSDDEAPPRPPPRRLADPMECDAAPPPRRRPAARKPVARKSPKKAGQPNVSIEALLAKARAAKAKK